MQRNVREWPQMDSALLTAGLLAIVCGALLLLLDVSLLSKKIALTHAAKSVSIATLTTDQSDVRLRAATATTWEPIATDQAIHDKDVIFTDADSTAKIQFLSGGEWSLGPLSLVTVDEKARIPSLELRRGVFAARFAKQGDQLVIRHKGSETRLMATAASELAIETEESGNTQISVASGSVLLSQGTQQVPIQAHERRDVDADSGQLSAVIPIPVKLLEPSPNVSVTEGQVVRFRWEWRIEPRERRTVALELAQNARFTKQPQILALPMDGDTVDIPLLTPGKIFWRLRIGQLNGHETLTTARFVTIEPKPQILVQSPRDASTVTSAAKDPVFFSWISYGTSHDAKLELSRDAAFATVATSIVATSPQRLLVETSGLWYWRVRTDAVTTPPHSFTRDIASVTAAVIPVEKKAEPAKPLTPPPEIPAAKPDRPVAEAPPTRVQETPPESPVVSPEIPSAAPDAAPPEEELPAPKIRKEIEYKPQQGARERVRVFWSWVEWIMLGTQTAFADAPETMDWAAVPGAKSYRLQISMKTSFSSLAIDQNLPTPAFNPKILDPGTYWYRVAAVSASGKQGAFSPAGKLTIKPGRIMPLSPEHKSEVKDAAKSVHFSWKKPSDTVHSILEIAKNDDFKTDVQKFPCFCEDLTVPFETPGIYYWRVTGVYSNGAAALPTRVSRFQFQAKEVAARAAALQKAENPAPTPVVKAEPVAAPVIAQSPSPTLSRGVLSAFVAPMRVHDRSSLNDHVAPIDATVANSYGLIGAWHCGTFCRVNASASRAVSFTEDNDEKRLEFMTLSLGARHLRLLPAGWAWFLAASASHRREPVFIQETATNKDLQSITQTALQADIGVRKMLFNLGDATGQVGPRKSWVSGSTISSQLGWQARVAFERGWEQNGLAWSVFATAESMPYARADSKWVRETNGIGSSVGFSF